MGFVMKMNNLKNNRKRDRILLKPNPFIDYIPLLS